MDPISAGTPGSEGAAGRVAARAACAVLFLLILALATTRATDTDLWWHIATGDLIRHTGRVPTAEPFSFTVVGHRWIDVHWLFQLGLSFLFGAGGVRAVEIARSAVILAAFALVWRRCRERAGPAASVLVLLAAVLASQERFLTRPEIVSWCFLLLVLDLLERALDAPARARRIRPLFVLLPLLQVVWVNVQSLFILEPVLIVLALATTLVQLVHARRRPEASGGAARIAAAHGDPDRPIDFLLALSMASLVALVNPYGAAALRLPFEEFFRHLGGASLLSRSIAEFQPPLSGYVVTPSIVAFVALGAAVLLAIVVRFPRVRTFDLLVTLATLLLALRARRNIPIFALAAAPILAGDLGALGAPLLARLDRTPGRGGPLARRLAGAPLLLALSLVLLGLTWDVSSDRFFLRRPTERWFGAGEIPDYFPGEAARFVDASAIPGNVFHPLWAGGYLIHAWHGERRVFIDGRNDPYLEDVLPAYLNAIASPTAFEEVTRRYQITCVLWPHQRALEGKTLLRYLSGRSGWVRVELDPAASVYLRADLLSPLHLSAAPGPEGDGRETYEDLARRLDRRPFDGPPVRDIALAEYFSVTAEPAGSEFFYRRALERLPRSAPVLYGLALSLERQGRPDEARAAYDRAIDADPDYAPALAARGASLLEAGRTDQAARDIERAYRGGERSVRLVDGRARLCEGKGDLNGAIAAYREGLRDRPGDVELLRALARFYLRHDQPDAALPFYTAASTADPDDPITGLEMAALLEKLGRTTAALDVARDAARRALERRRSAGRDASGGPRMSEEDRALLTFAAGLESRSGDPARAAEDLEALRSGEPPAH